MNIFESDEKGYKMIFSNQRWGVGYKNFSPEQSLVWQRHFESDEGFILLSGECCLLTKDGEKIELTWLEKGKFYLVKRNEWHFNLMFKDAEIFIVENNDVDDSNTENIKLKEREVNYLKQNNKVLKLISEIS
ncbi:cupin domain-containing protein [Halanaerobium sp. ST460_2HS_T2]|uniref:cupin domain-containing protein n=1 Tax=Halanaerobium sp. ST460_2HS_T2 TaxID=2183914 RepID=UPI000DF4059F|nr:cupin domain-containing protein [Halanaerobium sp. ST460_2HS_T2]RCW55369.1 hypothetical protein DFR80_11721 [Halanaerobium sp. ST460_2HS_T2]